MGKVELSGRSRPCLGWVGGKTRPRFACCSSGGMVSAQVTLRLQPGEGSGIYGRSRVGGFIAPERGQQRAGD